MVQLSGAPKITSSGTARALHEAIRPVSARISSVTHDQISCRARSDAGGTRRRRERTDDGQPPEDAAWSFIPFEKLICAEDLTMSAGSISPRAGNASSPCNAVAFSRSGSRSPRAAAAMIRCARKYQIRWYRPMMGESISLEFLATLFRRLVSLGRRSRAQMYSVGLACESSPCFAD